MNYAKNHRLALRRQVENLDWAARMFDDSVTPEAVDVDKLVKEIEAALRARRVEAMARVGR
jgi:hypothetical protein